MLQLQCVKIIDMLLLSTNLTSVIDETVCKITSKGCQKDCIPCSSAVMNYTNHDEISNHKCVYYGTGLLKEMMEVYSECMKVV
jgi:hypothetical protein